MNKQKLLNEIKQKTDFVKKILLTKEGILMGKIKPYDEALIDELRDVYYNGLPCSLMLLCSSVHCSNRHLIIAQGLKGNYKLIRANVESKKFYKDDNTVLNISDHYFIEQVDENGVTWVYDSAIFGIVEKNLYYTIEKPEILEEYDAPATDELCKDSKFSGAETTDYSINVLLSIIDTVANNEDDDVYKEMLQKEVQIFKESSVYQTFKKDHGVR